ncbi:hypothetical protein C8R44DRAFT_871466 [Mycena epipterygia]|nr:hypothetical protein C8R44DRAFT_871466 [Mycena epipterygia]
MHISATFLLLATSIYVSAQTLYDIPQSVFPSGFSTEVAQESVSISAAGVGADGGMTYIEIEVGSLIIDTQFPSTTISLLSVPTTITETFIADASDLEYSVTISGPQSVATLAEKCSFGTGTAGIGTCVLEEGFGAPTTYSGHVVPFFTLTAATPTPTTSANGAAPYHVFARWSVVWIVLGILFHNL